MQLVPSFPVSIRGVVFPVQQADIPYGLQWEFKALSNRCQLLINDTGKGQQLIALVVQGFPEFADCRVLLAFPMLQLGGNEVKVK